MNAPIQFDRSFASHEKAKYWSEKNGKVKPKDVYKSSHKKYWFDCDKCSHSFDKALNSVVCGRWCPYCPSQLLCDHDCEYCYNKSFASHEKSKYWSDKNGDVKPWDVFKSSHKKYWFDCDKCNHSFEASLANITKKTNPSWCLYCASKAMCNDEKCKKCYNKSFASHEKANYWSDKNNEVTPRNIFKSSDNKYLFDCHNCKHTFGITLSSIIGGNWCPYCSNKTLCNDDDCIYCYNNSFATHPKAKYWSEKNGNNVTPRTLFKCNGNKYWFDCDKCFHTFECTPHCITAGNWCPYCAIPLKRLCENNDCKYCFKKSFASHPKAKYWSEKNGDIKPRNVSKCNSQKYCFDCENNHSFYAVLSRIAYGGWCPYCKNKTETKLLDALKPLYPTLITQFKQEWCKNKIRLPFDFCIPEHKIIIELDGRQHFTQVSNWKCPEETFKIDLFKETCANDNGYSVIRILQEDVLYDKYDWFDRIQTEIENIIKDDTIIHNVYMAEDGEYDKFIDN